MGMYARVSACHTYTILNSYFMCALSRYVLTYMHTGEELSESTRGSAHCNGGSLSTARRVTRLG
jgi:hypothetical protein